MWSSIHVRQNIESLIGLCLGMVFIENMKLIITTIPMMVRKSHMKNDYLMLWIC